MAERGNILRFAFTLHVETTLVSLIGLIMFRREVCENMDGEIAVALIDYCARKMVFLATPIVDNPSLRRQKEPLTASELSEYIQGRNSLEEIQDTLLDSEFKTSIATVSLARYLCEHIESLSLAGQSRILNTHDFLLILIQLIDEPPWTRKRDSNIWEKFIDNSWQEVAIDHLLQFTNYEAQCWIMVFHLCCTPVCRERYALNTFRKDQILRLRKYLNEFIFDQVRKKLVIK